MWYGRCVGKDNKYVLLTSIGKGAYAEVWLAYVPGDDSFVAVKIINDEYGDIAIREKNALELFRQAESPLAFLKEYFVEDQDFLEDEDSTEGSGGEEDGSEADSAQDGSGEEENSATEEEEEDSTNEEGEEEEDEGSAESGEEESVFYPFRYHFLTMPLYGGTLFDVYQSMSIPKEVIDRIFVEVKAYLVHLHDRFGLIHGDVKPENIAFVGPNVKCERIIQRFRELGGLGKYLKEAGDDMQSASYQLIDDLLVDDDYEESSDFDSSVDSTETEWANVDEQEGGSEADTASLTEEEDDDDDDETETQVVLTGEELANLKVMLIDYSHVHTPNEGNEFIPTRYYRCPQTIKKEPASFYKDWFALGCTMYELENQEILIDPPKRNRRKEHLRLIDEKFHLIKDWLADMPCDVPQETDEQKELSQSN